MPQMSPMMWLTICLFSLITLSMLKTNITKKLINNKSMKIKSKNIAWKW